MKRELEIGTLLNGKKFTLPLDLVTRTLAIIAIRGWGKTVAATVIAEEMCEAGLPWVAIDPVGVWWGLRANPDGSAGGYPVVILGGEHADLPLEKSSGPRVAEAVLQENVSCVVDMSSESKNTVRHFVTEFCDRLMELRPEVPRHVFIEEAPELVPQRPMAHTSLPAPTNGTEEVAMSLEVKRPVIDLVKRKYVIEANDEDQFGRIVLLLSEGFFDSPKKIEHINKEFITRGWAAGTGQPSPKNLDMGKLAEYGFVRVVGAGTYQAVPGMEVNVREVAAA